MRLQAVMLILNLLAVLPACGARVHAVRRRHASPASPSPVAPVTIPSPDTFTPPPAAHPTSPPAPRSTFRAPVAGAISTGCAWALSYLAAHLPPGWAGYCPAYAGGHQAMTVPCSIGRCIDPTHIGEVHIAVECEASVLNEVHNAEVYPRGPYWGQPSGRFGEQPGYGAC